MVDAVAFALSTLEILALPAWSSKSGKGSAEAAVLVGAVGGRIVSYLTTDSGAD